MQYTGGVADRRTLGLTRDLGGWVGQEPGAATCWARASLEELPPEAGLLQTARDHINMTAH